MYVTDLLPAFLRTRDRSPLPCAAGDLDPETFFAEDADTIARAVAVCAGCPPSRRAACADWAREHRAWGVWGGEGDADRARAGRPPIGLVGTAPAPRPAARRTRPPCGTDAAHQRHLRRAEPPCRACAAAHDAVQRLTAHRPTSPDRRTPPR
ncbi:WhiB family transcriptional regulator (plasmid) [Streptomyces sp. BI20]|uniref:WhiB family transcriptional regulator n=1 Tax=Streptomyces sp. BI20 TaxID=3403460 RepID=UPI003C7134B2